MYILTIRCTNPSNLLDLGKPQPSYKLLTIAQDKLDHACGLAAMQVAEEGEALVKCGRKEAAAEAFNMRKWLMHIAQAHRQDYDFNWSGAKLSKSFRAIEPLIVSFIMAEITYIE